MPAPTQLLSLIERFARNRDDYHKGQFNETQLRVDYLNPVFELLGWDMTNKAGYAEKYRDVIHEAQVKVGGVTKAPDYCFKIGPERKFFLEAKKPSVNIKDDGAPAFQLRRYAWSANLPLSILTDFEEFAVYDCRVKPDRLDRASVARVIYFTFDQLAEKWDEFAAIFSKEAVLQGSFDRFAESTKTKRGTAEVDDAFLAEIEGWRDMLARDIAKRNGTLSQGDLNDAVQRTIDRIIFLRICEDRGIEDYGRLQALANGANVYARLMQLFHHADARYNSGLFHFQNERGQSEAPDELTPELVIDDKVLKEIFRRLYYPDSPYEFSVFSGSVLGQVYEQFLGKVITLDAKHRATIEEKPEVRKAGGVYYTPEYIARYIVQNTVGKLVEGKAPKDVAKLRVLDPACGSGSFLLVAYAHLLDWHLQYYSDHEPEKLAARKDSPIYQAPALPTSGDLFAPSTANWRLTTGEKKRILINNIFGVDIDRQAVEVTKLSLLLKMLEGESDQSLGRQMKLMHERVLPDLADNIKCGNSLIGSDFYDDPANLALDMESRRRINAFDWSSEFRDVMRDGGFDAVIGNPPYIRIQAMKEWAPVEVEFYKAKYRSASKGNYDIYVVFAEKALSLLNPDGLVGYILPHKFFNAKYGEPLRGIISEGEHLSKVVHFGDQQVFEGVSTYTCLLFLSRASRAEFEVNKVDNLFTWRAMNTAIQGIIASTQATQSEWNFRVGEGRSLFGRLEKMSTKLGTVATAMFVGLQTSADTVYLFKRYENGDDRDTIRVFSKELTEWIEIERCILKEVVRSGSIERYHAKPAAVVLFPYEVTGTTARLYTSKELQDAYPLAWTYLLRNRGLLEDREKGAFRGADWYRFGRSQNLGMWEQPKLMVPYMLTELACYPDEGSHLYFINVTTGGYGITIDDNRYNVRYICALLNSLLLDYYLKCVSTNFRGGYFAANKQYIEQLPIRAIDFAVSSDKARHDHIVTLVDQMLSLHGQLAATKTASDKTFLQRQIKQTDRQIDRLIYELYGLTEEEIAIVESAGEALPES